MTVPKLLFCTRLGAQSQWIFSLSWLFDEGRLELLRDTLRSPLAHFPRFCWQYFSLTTTFSIHLARKMYFLLCSGFRNIFLITFLYFAYKIKSSFVGNHGHFLKCWLVLRGFLCVFSQSETICNLHSCYKFALVLQKNWIPLSANQNWVIFSCILSGLEYPVFEPTPLRFVRADSEFMD